jgi:hypothetical protein
LKSGWAVLAVALVALASTVRADDVVGSITRVQGNTLTVKLDDGGTVTVRVNNSTEVEFTDGGDKRAWPNPSVSDLRVGMGVKIPDGQTTLDHIKVHFVPEGMHRGGGIDAGNVGLEPAQTGSEQLKVRIQSITRNQMTADVAGRSRTFPLANSGVARDFRNGDLVVVHLENGRVVQIDPTEMRGVVRSVNERARTVDISVNGRTTTYPVTNEKDLRDLRSGDTVHFELEDRGSRQVVSRIYRD